MEFSSHYQLGTTEELVKTILSDVIHGVLRKMNGDGPQERRGDLTVERLERKKKRVNKKKEKSYISFTSALSQMLLMRFQRNNNKLK